MPRFCSSGSRSVSLPVNARTSQVLPWSMCPAVPTVSGMGVTLPRRMLGEMLRALGRAVAAVLFTAAAYELTLALGAGSVGPDPGEGVEGEGVVQAVALLAILAGAALG